MILRTRDNLQRVVVLGLAGGVAALAWLAFLAMPGLQASGEGVHAQMHGVIDAPDPRALAGGLGLFLGCWVAMTAAMMVPTALPMLATFSRLVGSRPDSAGRVALFIAGYFGAWSAFGVAAYLGDLPVHLAVHRVPFLADHAGLIEAGLLCLVGLFQLTPLKQRCLSQCRSPFSFLMNHWREGKSGALRMGLHHGTFCVGCCWALMLLMFGVGMAHLGWMLALTLLLFAEKVVRRGELIGRAAGLVFLVTGLVSVAMALGAPAP